MQIRYKRYLILHSNPTSAIECIGIYTKCETDDGSCWLVLGGLVGWLVCVADGGGAEASEAVRRGGGGGRRRPSPPPAQTPDRHSTSRRRHTHQLQQPSDPQKVTLAEDRLTLLVLAIFI